MLQQPLLLTALPSAVVDMTTDFAPLFMGTVIGLCLCVLAFAFAIGVYDSRWTRQAITQTDDHSRPVSDLSDAA